MAEKQADNVAVIEPEEQTAPREKPHNRPKRLPPYHVILWNDEDHTYWYVIAMMQKLFGRTLEEGYQIAKEVDTQGKSVVLTTTKEHAELKRDQIHAYGKDNSIQACKGSMYASIEPSVG